MPDGNAPAQTTARRRRQKRTLTVLAWLLIAGGLLVLFVLDRVPLPLRIVAGLGDVVAGCVLLVVSRQKFAAPEGQPNSRS